MSTLRHAREAKRLLRQRLGSDPRVVGIGITAPAAGREGGYAVEVRLGSELEAARPATVRADLEGDTADVPVRWRVVGEVHPRGGES